MPLPKSASSFLSVRSRRWLCVSGLALTGLLILIAVLIDRGNDAPVTQAPATAHAAHPAGPPWRYGQADARFTFILYADFECPYCKTYFPMLTSWVDRHPEANLQWHHLPLSAHEPAATRQARLAECAGETGGHAAFWETATWIYEHTRGDGLGVPDNLRYPRLTSAMQSCLDSERPQAIIQAQAGEGARAGVTATPTLRLNDHATGKSLAVQGPVEGDALLSALDLLTANEAATAEPPESAGMPADVVGDMPR